MIINNNSLRLAFTVVDSLSPVLNRRSNESNHSFDLDISEKQN